MNAQEAIERSRSHDEIVTLDAFDEDDYQTLLVECDDNVDANGMLEFWADDPDSDTEMLWRVHMPAERKGVA